MPVARLAANLVLPLEHPFWGPAARPKRCLPCAAWFQSGRVRRFRPASASSWRGPLPGAHFMALSKEANDLILTNLVIVLRGSRPKLYFLELRAAAALALLMRLFILLVKKFTIVGDLANRGIGGRRDFHQVESPFTRQTNSLVRLHHPKLGAFLINHPDFARPNPLINAGTVALPEAPFCDISP